MSKPIIEINGVSKMYRLGEFGARSLREEAELAWKRIWKRNGEANAINGNSDSAGRRKPSREEFWALRDVSFSVQAGEVVGIIGRNGAGKSTLLKILSRITKPTTGEIVMRGRVASLLEVGTGFHPELSGRENIYLNGAILGMRSGEITRKLEEIVAFAEVEKFLDTPVKRYSSGMYVRLAFAVAAHLEPEILIVDEVLAVGDAEFQKKCLGKMQQISRQDGRTVIFVSHQLAAIRRLCTSACLLKQGQTEGLGLVESAIGEYSANVTGSSLDIDLRSRSAEGAVGVAARLTRLQVISEGGLQYGEPLAISCFIECSAPINNAIVGIGFDTLDGTRIMTIDSDNDGGRAILRPGLNEVRLSVQRNPLHPAIYVCGAAILIGGQPLDAAPACATWEVTYGPNVTAVNRGFAGCRPPVEVAVIHP